MIAAARRRIVQWSWRVDRVVNRELERAAPALQEIGRRVTKWTAAAVAWLGPRVRPLAAAFFRALALAEAAVRRTCTALARVATAASGVVTPRRAAAAAIVAGGLLLVASQFIDYRGVEIGQPAYRGLSGVATAPTLDVRTAGEAHAYLLVPVGLIAAVLGLLAARRSRPRFGLAVAVLGLVSVLVIVLVDRPAGLDVGTQATRFSGASAVLDDGYYAELAAAGALVFCGLLYYARPCLIRISSSGRAASARRRRPRPPASSPARAARSA